MISTSAPSSDIHTHLFIGGLHRSGTSLVHRLMSAHPSVSGFSDTGVPEDEGQHLQNLYSSAKAHGGPGRFAFDETAHLTESNHALVETCKTRLWPLWAPHWDLSKPVLIEKSPPNLIRARFLQAVFPNSKFIFVIRHPLAVSAATQKWSKQPITELIQHWVRAHQILMNDLPQIKSWAWVRYEDLSADATIILRDLFKFTDLQPISPTSFIKDSNGAYFSAIAEPIDIGIIKDLEAIEKFGYKLDSPYYEMAPGVGRVISNMGGREASTFSK
jgi:hypothetical protein